MKACSFIPLLILLSAIVLVGQNPKEREWLEKLSRTGKDTSRVHALCELGVLYGPNDYSKALFYLQEARTLAVELEDPFGIARADLTSSRVYYYQDEYQISKKYLEKAMDLYDSLAYKPGQADCYFALGELEMLFGNYVRAFESYQHSLQLEKETGDLHGESILLNCLSGFHRELGKLDVAMDYALESMALKSVLNDSAGLATSFTSLSGIFECQNKLDSAEHYARLGLKIRQQMKDDRRIAASRFALGRILNAKGIPSEANRQLDQSYEQFSRLEDKTGMVIVLLEQGISLDLLGHPTKSLQRVEKALSLAKITQNNTLLKDTYKNMSDYYLNRGEYRQGHEYFVRYKNLEDSILDWRKNTLIEEMEMRFQGQLKDVEIQKLRTENELQQKNNIILWLSLVSILILTALLLYLYRMNSIHLKHHKQLLEKEKIIRQKDQVMQDKERIVLEDQLELKNRELGAKILAMLRTNEMQETLVNRLKKMSVYIGNEPNALKELQSILREMEDHSALNLWEEFDKTFQSIHSEFYKKLLETNPDLSPSEIKLAAFLKLNLSTKEIAALTFKTESGIKSTRHRLRKKLGLTSDSNLVNFLIRL